MHQVAEKGITAPGLLSFTDDLTHSASTTHHTAHQRAREWLRGLLEIQKSASDSQEFLEHVKTDLFPDEVYVFTPQGKILQLPKGVTAIDFAYAIHSDIGDQCIAAKVDNQYVPLSTTLMSGQTVEVFTATWARPNPSWLNFAVSARARSHIRHFLKNLQYDKAILLGRRMLEKELAVYSLSIEKLCEEQCQQLLESFKINSLEALLADIGLGNRIALIVARQLVPEAYSALKPLVTGESKPLMIKGTEDILVHFARCCRPIPGDDIVGFISAGRGIIIHTATCRHVAEYRHQPEKLQAVEWEPEITGEFVVDISIEVHNQLGVLATIAAGITNMESNIEQVSNENHEGQSIIKFCILVRHRVHLASIMRHLRRLEDVIRIHRSKN
ncbi:guanosine-3',5'-bis(diphosphate) 3'-pyrophosphohydrolase [Beggiatoa sp. PS]|nr:guanosine-3',5'-bis(diphosphate) 3'-pyrophosphohydrolase [Beggiatoa sp. PS]